MAGSYADAPGFKMPYDVDGSAGFASTGGTPSAMTGTELANFNDETASNGAGGALNGIFIYQGIIFPQLRDIYGFGFHQGMTNSAITTVQTSTDTTTGMDGTWTTRVSNYPQASEFSAGAPAFRTTYRGTGGVAEASLPYLGVKAIRFVGNGNNNNGNNVASDLHLYGNIASGQSLDRLRLWHATLDQEIAAGGLDYGDFGRGGSIDRTFRVKNNSSSLTANSILLSLTALTDTSPTVLGQMSISQGGSFASTQNIGNLAPSAISAVCTLRIASTSSTILGPWRQRLIATAGSWT